MIDALQKCEWLGEHSTRQNARGEKERELFKQEMKENAISDVDKRYIIVIIEIFSFD